MIELPRDFLLQLSNLHVACRVWVGMVLSHVVSGGVAVEWGIVRYFGWVYFCIGGWLLLHGHCPATLELLCCYL